MTREKSAEKNSGWDTVWNRTQQSTRNPLWRDGAMTDGHGSFSTLREHLVAVARGPEGDRLLARLRRCGLRVGDADDFTKLLGRPVDRRQRAAVMEGLAAWAPRDELAALGLVHLMAFELEKMAARLARLGHLDPDEAEADVLASAWETLTRRPPPGRDERLEAIWTAARRATGVRRPLPDPLPEDFDAEVPEGPCPSEHWPGLLDAAVSAGVLSCAEAMLIVRTRVDGEPLRRVAADLGRPYDALRMERRRAEAALRVYVSSSGASS